MKCISYDNRIANNLQVLKLLKSNKIDKNVISNYTGWGGLKKAIYTPSIYKELKSLLCDEEITSIKASTSNAYFTPTILARFIWAVLDKHFKFKRGVNEEN